MGELEIKEMSILLFPYGKGSNTKIHLKVRKTGKIETDILAMKEYLTDMKQRAENGDYALPKTDVDEYDHGPSNINEMASDP